VAEPAPFETIVNQERTKQIYQYALLLAAAEEEWDTRELGPIHLLKYAYLADLAFAEFQGGETFTGINWTFHRFGPWSNEAFQLIDEAVGEIDAVKRTLPSDYTKDSVRYSVEGTSAELSEETRALRTKLPLEIKGLIEQAVHRYKADTQALLFMVYATAPMLSAAPGETLDFNCMVREPTATYQCVSDEDFVPLLDQLSNKKRKQIPARMKELREQLAERYRVKLESEAGCLMPATGQGEQEVLDWVDSFAGDPFPVGSVTVQFDPSVWKSASRNGEEWGDDVSE
jgi:hypothetical protein